jgi:murein DD-endopeptidase MepM/ murein hydrolase activator NlpD
MRQPLNQMVVTSKFGYRVHPVTKERSFHNGVDLRARMGDPVFAAISGRVSFSTHKTGGKQLVIQHPGGLRVGYAHLSKYADGLEDGDLVNEGELVAYAGDSGRVTGPHLHFTTSVVLGGSKKFFNPESLASLMTGSL